MVPHPVRSRSLALAVLALALAGCAPGISAYVRPAIDADGRGRPVHLTLGPGVEDDLWLQRDLHLGGWRATVGDAVSRGLMETFTVVDRAGPGVLELQVLRASPGLFHQAGRHGGAQTVDIDYQVRLLDDRGLVLGRASGVASRTVSGELPFEQAMARAVEALVREAGGRLLGGGFSEAPLPPTATSGG